MSGFQTGEETDPTGDPAATDVLAAYGAAERAGRDVVDCYCAGVEAWRRAYPDHAPAYAARQAVSVILAVKGRLRAPDP